jgi:hypothetical protein
LYPKIFGIYERELQAWIEEIIASNFREIHVVGAAEGYYAVGMAWRSKKSKVYAYEMDEKSHDLISQLATINHVSDRVQIHGGCTQNILNNYLKQDSCVIMDIEGAEEFVLEPSLVTGLSSCTILFESHFKPEETRYRILSKFKSTHTIGVIKSQPRTWKDIPCFSFIFRFYIHRNIQSWWYDEIRGGEMEWYYLKPIKKSF